MTNLVEESNQRNKFHLLEKMAQLVEASIVPQISSCLMKLHDTLYNDLEILLLDSPCRNCKTILSKREKKHATNLSETCAEVQNNSGLPASSFHFKNAYVKGRYRGKTTDVHLLFENK